MPEANDWRLRGQEEFLQRATLVWQSYRPANPRNDHDHCEFCWAKFMQTVEPDTLQIGYSTMDREHWICKPCFDDFAAMFEWQVKNAA